MLFRSVAGMAVAFERWIKQRGDVSAVLSAAGSCGTAIAAPAFRILPLGVPKLIVSTVASGQIQQYVGASDMLMMNAVADVQGLNFITRNILRNAAEAIVGMTLARRTSRPEPKTKATVGMTMSGVTTPCVTRISDLLIQIGRAHV